MRTSRTTLIALALALSAAGHARAQSPDSLILRLGSPDWQERAVAVHGLNGVPMAELPATYGPAMIRLLDREADAPVAESEGYGEYLIALVRGILRLQDPASLPGMAVIGIQVNHDAQVYVAGRGAEALPYLDRVWSERPEARAAVAATWAAMTGEEVDGISEETRVRALARVLAIRRSEPMAFVLAARRAGLTAAIPLLEEMEATGATAVRRGVAGSAARELRQLRERRTPAATLSALDRVRASLCLDATGRRASSCGRLAGAVRSAEAGLRVGAGTARARLEALVRETAGADGFSADERSLIAGTARYLADRVER